MPERLHVTAEQIMSPGAPTLSEDDSIASAINLLANEAIACAVIVDASGAPKGIVTESDILALADDEQGTHLATVLQRMLQEEHHIFDTLRRLRGAEARVVGDVAKSPVTCADAGDSIGQVAALLERYDYRQLPVVKDGRLIGIVGRQEIVKAIADRA